MDIMMFLLGLVALLAGAELLVRGASAISLGLGLSPLVVGLTIVAFGTSSPELAVSVSGSLSGSSDVALGNVVGSNIFNVLFILGLAALITPLAVQRQIVRLEAPILVAVSVLAGVLALDGTVSRVDGLVLVALLVGYTTFTVVRSRRESKAAPVEERPTERAPAYLRDGLFIVVGLGLLVLGSDWLVDGSVKFARHMGISEIVIALTIIAAGTSLPEVATSVMAAIRGERDIAVGNVVGSNVFNLLGVLGMSATVAPAGLTITGTSMSFDVPIMIGVAILVLPIFFTGHRINRWEGGLLLGYYVAYVVLLLLRATEHVHADALGLALGGFVVPMTVLTLGIVVLREIRSKSA